MKKLLKYIPAAWTVSLALIMMCHAQPDGRSVSMDSSLLKADVYFLASGELQGRETGLAGAQTAAVFLASRLYALQLKPFFEADKSSILTPYYQTFEMAGAVPSQVESSLTFHMREISIEARPQQDYFYFFNSPLPADLKGDVCFVGYGIQAPEFNYDDLSGRDCKGKIALAFYGEPQLSGDSLFFNGDHITHYSLPGWKTENLAKTGAKALILIPDPARVDYYDKFLQRQGRRSGETQFVLQNEKSLPVIYLSGEFAKKVFGRLYNGGDSPEQKRLQKWASGKSGNFQWREDAAKNLQADLKIKLPQTEVRKGRNVLAVLPGSDPQLRDEYILGGTHFDHEGIKENRIYFGADDNASGVAANLNIARALAGLSKMQQPQRSIIFAFWDAEEKGMLGSRYFLDHPPVPLSRIKAAFNMDMIGRDASFNFAALRQPMMDEDAENKVMIFYSAQAPQLAAVARKVNITRPLHLLFDPNAYFTSGSDHAAFHEAKIPVVYYFTGFHTDYSQPGDTPDKIDFQKLTRIAGHIAAFVKQLADMPEMPDFDNSVISAPEGDFSR
ncbi:MAG: M28 family peptidase [Calditrichia bacterium]